MESKKETRRQKFISPTWDMVPDDIFRRLVFQIMVPYDVAIKRMGLYYVPFASYATAKKYCKDGDIVRSFNANRDYCGVSRVYYVSPKNMSLFGG